MAVTPRDDEGKPAVSLPPSTAQDVHEYVQLQQDALLKSLQPIQDRMGQALVWQAANTGQLTKGLQQSVRGRVKAQQKALEDIGNVLRDHISTLIDEQQVRLNHSILQLPSGVRATPSFFPVDQTVGGEQSSSPFADIHRPPHGQCNEHGCLPTHPYFPSYIFRNRLGDICYYVDRFRPHGTTILTWPPCSTLPVPPPPPPPPPIRWYCQQLTDGTRVCIVNPTPGHTIVGGPYATQEECLAACRGEKPPPPPPPPPPPDCDKQWICNWQDLYSHLPGSSCDKPLYIVLCVPKKEPEVCPVPPELPSGVRGGRGVAIGNGI